MGKKKGGKRRGKKDKVKGGGEAPSPLAEEPARIASASASGDADNDTNVEPPLPPPLSKETLTTEKAEAISDRPNDADKGDVSLDFIGDVNIPLGIEKSQPCQSEEGDTSQDINDANEEEVAVMMGGMEGENHKNEVKRGDGQEQTISSSRGVPPPAEAEAKRSRKEGDGNVKVGTLEARSAEANDSREHTPIENNGLEQHPDKESSLLQEVVPETSTSSVLTPKETMEKIENNTPEKEDSASSAAKEASSSAMTDQGEWVVVKESIAVSKAIEEGVTQASAKSKQAGGRGNNPDGSSEVVEGGITTKEKKSWAAILAEKTIARSCCSKRNWTSNQV